MTSMNSGAPAEPQDLDPCEACQQRKLTSYCTECDCIYCDTCWELQPPHKQSKRGNGGRQHEKTNHSLMEKIKDIFNPAPDIQQLESLHREDEATKWFGTEKTRDGGMQFTDHGRYRELMADTRPPGGSPRFPKLVSFIGDTC